MGQVLPAQPAVMLQTGSIQEIPVKRQEVVAQLLETYRHGDPTQSQQALAELETMGEIETF